MEAKVGRDISEAAELLKAGKLVAIPTETVYGLAGDALNEQALADVFAVKERPRFDPLILHVDNLAKLRRITGALPAAIEKLAREFSPGPLTYVLPKAALVPDLATAGKPTVAVRIPNHPTTLALLRSLSFPLAAPSANPFGYVSPTTPAHVQAQLSNRIPYILDGGAAAIGVESTIIQPGTHGIEVLRLGGTPIEELERVVGTVHVKRTPEPDPQAPGQLSSHYAPSIKLRIGNPASYARKVPVHQMGVISFRHFYQGIPSQNQFVLSPRGDLKEAAQNLFGALRHLDGLGLKLVVAEGFPEEGLGRAINDRLQRAAADR